MRDAIALQGLQKIAGNYEQHLKDLKNLRRKVRELTAQRDVANAKNASLRSHILMYQNALKEARAEVAASKPSAWVTYHDNAKGKP